MFTAFFLLAIHAAAVVDPTADDGFSFPGFFSTNWDRIGGWSLFIGLCILIVVGAFREWWVPGARLRRVEESAAKQSETLASTVHLLEKSTTANEITKYFFEETVPKRGEPRND